MRLPTAEMLSRSESRIGAACAVAGSALLLVGTYLHPMEADPNDAVAAFTEYAADHLWIAAILIHLTGMALIVVALLFLAHQFELASGMLWTRISEGGATVSLALATVLQTVDGIALKHTVDAWTAAPEAR